MTPNKDWTIRLLTTDDAEMLSDLAIKIYTQHYTQLWHDDGKWYTEYSYAIEKLRKELADLNNVHYAAYDGEKPVGYLKIKLWETWKGLSERNCLEVERIYVLREEGGAGLGTKLMKIAFEVANYHHQNTVFLKAMDTSSNSIGFYQNLGFEIFDTLILPFEQMKLEYRGMYVLKKRLPTISSAN